MNDEARPEDEFLERDSVATPNQIFYPDLVKPNQTPIGITPIQKPAYEAPPTFSETLGASFRQYNTVVSAGIALSNIKNPFKASLEHDLDYHPVQEGLLDDIPEEFHMRVLRQPNRQDAMAVIAQIQQELEDKKISSRSGTIANLISSLGATVVDPTILIPFSQTVKYASVSRGAYVNMINTAKTMGPAIALQNAVLFGTKETGQLQEWAYQTLFESFVAAGIGGALGAFAAKGAKAELRNAQGVFKAIENDVEIKYKLDNDGKVLGPVAVPTADSSVGAKAVEDIQALLDSGQVNFKNKGWVRTAFGWGSPIIQGVTNRFEVARQVTNDLFPNVFEVAGGVVGAIKGPDAYSFVKQWRSTNEHAGIFMHAQWLDYLGLKGPGKGIRATTGSWTGKWMAYEEFSEMVAKAHRRGGESEIPQVAEAAKLYDKEVYKPLFKELQKRYPTLQEHQFSNISSYLNRVYDKDKIMQNPDLFIQDVERYLSDNNNSIIGISEPIEAARASGDKALLAKLEGELNEKIINGDIPLDLLEGKLTLGADQIEAINKLNKPIQEAEESLASLRKELKALGKDKSNLEARKSKRKEISSIKEKIKSSKEKILADMESGAIPEDLFYRTTRGAFLHDVNAIPKLRKVLTPEQIRSVAEGVRNNITQLNEEQVLGQIFDSVTSGGNDPLKTRTLLWNDSLAEPWLQNRMDVLSGLYTDQIAKRIYFDDVVRQYGGDSKDGMKGIVRNLLEQRNIEELNILKKPDSPARAKELSKLQKDFKTTEKLMEDMYKIYMGNYVDKTTTAYRITDGVKKFGVATLLGNLPILQLTEFFSPLFRFTFSEYIQDGLIPALQKMKAWAASGEYSRGAYADMGMGVNRYIGNRTQALAGYGAQYSPRTVAERYVDNLAKWSQNFSLANYIMDAQEVMVGGMAESSLIRALKKYVSGEKLVKREIDMLDRARFNPKEWADSALQQYAKYGQDVEGAFNPNFHLWDNQDVARQFRISVEKMTREVLIKPGPLDSPLIFKDPLMSLLTQFTSYVFAATNNFTIPLLTSADSQKMFGMIMMMTAGSLVGPLRSLAKGEEVSLDPGELANEAMNNSGVFGWQYDALMRLNSALDLEPLRFLQSSRMRSKALTLGPASGLYGMATSFLSAAANGEMNQADLARGMKLLTGFGYNWWSRQPIDYALQSFDLPKNRQEAKKRKQGEE